MSNFKLLKVGLKAWGWKRLTEYVSHVKIVVNKLGRNGKMSPTCQVVEKILKSLTNDFENIVCTIEEFQGLVNTLGWRACWVTWGAWAIKEDEMGVTWLTTPNKGRSSERSR